MTSYLIAAFLGLHGAVHVMGFAGTWRVAEFNRISSSPSLIPSVSAGSPVALALGVLWVVAAAAFLAAGVGLAAGSPSWTTWAIAGALISLPLCVAWWRDAPAGVAIDIAILVGLVLTASSTSAATGIGR